MAGSTGKTAAFITAQLICWAATAQTWDVFDMTTAGFQNNTINDIAIDSQDNVWVGTNWGLCKYDGTDWTLFLTSNSGLTDNVIHALATDSLDRVWIGTQLNGVVVFDGSIWTSYTTSNSPLPDNEIKCITIDHRGWAWIGTYLGLVCYTGVDWRLYDDTPSSYGGLQLNGPVIEDVAVREDGLVAIGTLNGGFHYLTDTLVVVHATYIDLFPDNTQMGVVFDEVHDERWMATPSQGLLRQGGDWYGGSWFQYAMGGSGIPTNSLTSIAMDDQGLPWMGTSISGVVVRNSNGSFTSYTSSNSGLPDNTIECLAFASDGALWVGTYYGGAARFNPSEDLGEYAMREQVMVHPNPFTDSFYITSEGTPGPLEWTLRDLGGRLLASGRLAAGEPRVFNPTGIASGVYLVDLLHAGGHATVRVVKR